MNPRVLGISASLRNARYGSGSSSLKSELAQLGSLEELNAYLAAQTKIRLEDFVAAGRAEGKPFDEIYDNLRRLRGERGLSNSEAALAAALWAAHREGAEIDHLALTTHFPLSGKPRDLDQLAEALVSADAIILSGPVYFGDRGSLAQSLIEFIAARPDVRSALRGKVYGGLAVGAKRNGGQETTLIYQMLDMVNLDLLAVGNGHETTAQYGGTAVGGDVGTLHSDAYGLETCVGTGKRVAEVARLLSVGRDSGAELNGPLRVQMWLLQDTAEGTGRAHFEAWAKEVSALDGNVEFTLVDVTREEVVRCIACDICPTEVGPQRDYRCIIANKTDFFVRHHEQLLDADAVLMCSYSPQARDGVVSNYQQFIERTRYLRRDNYAFSNLLFAPFVISELAARQNLHMRMLTSGIRHHTVLQHPLIGMVHEGEILARSRLVELGGEFVRRARELTLGRLLSAHPTDIVYNPVGYQISLAKSRADVAGGHMARIKGQAAIEHGQTARERIIPVLPK